MLRRLYIKISAFIVLAVTAGAIISSASSASALSYGGMSIKPGPDSNGQPRRSFHLVASEGTEVHEKVQVSNNGSSQVTLFVFGSAQNLENNALKPAEITQLNAGDPTRWIAWDTNEITLAPKTAKEINFVIKVPTDADVGDHVGAIMTSVKTVQAQNRGQSGLNVITQVGVQLALVVPGDLVRELTINKIRHSINRHTGRVLNFVFNATNKGNASLYPILDTKISGLFGRVGTQDNVSLDGIARNQTTDFNYNWVKRAPYFGRFVANFTFHLGEKEQMNKDGTTTLLPDKIIKARYVFWVIPWLELLYLIIGIVILYLLRSLWLYVLVMNRLRTKTESYTAVNGDTIMKIGAKFGADPRVLAKYNLMKWPYEIKPGDVLLIPTGRYVGPEWRQRHLDILSNREFLGGIMGHLFNWSKKAHHIVDKVIGKNLSSSKYEKVIVDPGDTIHDVADFASTTVANIAKINNLKLPYRLKAGQELYIPKPKPAPKKGKRK